MIKKKFQITTHYQNRYPVSMLLASGFITAIELEADVRLAPDPSASALREWLAFVDFSLQVCGRNIFTLVYAEKGKVTFDPPIRVDALDTFVSHINNPTTRVTIHFAAESFDPPSETWDKRPLTREYIEANLRKLAPVWEDDE